MNIHFTGFFPYRDSINHRVHVISIWDSLEFTQAMRVPCGLNIHHLGVHVLRIHPLWNYSLSVKSSVHYGTIHPLRDPSSHSCLMRTHYSSTIAYACLFEQVRLSYFYPLQVPPHSMGPSPNFRTNPWSDSLTLTSGDAF